MSIEMLNQRPGIANKKTVNPHAMSAAQNRSGPPLAKWRPRMQLAPAWGMGGTRGTEGPAAFAQRRFAEFRSENLHASTAGATSSAC
jgi:hypothetical protein